MSHDIHLHQQVHLSYSILSYLENNQLKYRYDVILIKIIC